MTAGAFLSGRVAAHGLMRGIFRLARGRSPWCWRCSASRRAHQVTAVLAVFLLGLVPTILVPMLQTRLMDVAHEGQSLAAALNHSTLNMANALGAWLGSVVLSAGLGYEWPSRVGAVLAVAGLGIAAWSALLGRRQRAAGVLSERPPGGCTGGYRVPTARARRSAAGTETGAHVRPHGGRRPRPDPVSDTGPGRPARLATALSRRGVSPEAVGAGRRPAAHGGPEPRPGAGPPGAARPARRAQLATALKETGAASTGPHASAVVARWLDGVQMVMTAIGLHRGRR